MVQERKLNLLADIKKFFSTIKYIFSRFIVVYNNSKIARLLGGEPRNSDGQFRSI